MIVPIEISDELVKDLRAIDGDKTFFVKLFMPGWKLDFISSNEEMARIEQAKIYSRQGTKIVIDLRVLLSMSDRLNAAELLTNDEREHRSWLLRIQEDERLKAHIRPGGPVMKGDKKR